MSENYKELGDKIKEIRRKKNIKQSEMAKSLGVTQSYISKIENGWAAPNFDFLKNFRSIYKVNLNTLCQ